jgi:ATP-dependent DNA helicase RecQ
VRFGIAAAAFHAGLPTDERARVQDRFQQNELAIIVATNAFGMGVDKPDVRLVLHAAPPLTLEAYYQEAGRGGRDGAMADCVLLLAPHDLERARARILAVRVDESLLTGLVRLLEGWRTRPSTALGASQRDVSAALRLLREEGVIAPSRGGGTLRVITTEARLATDRSIPPEDARALRALLEARDGRAGEIAPLTTSDLTRVAPDGDLPRFLQRLSARQLAVWQPAAPPWQLLRRASASILRTLAVRHATRQARDAWRHHQVARMVTAPRCRRLVLLRYFGDTGPEGRCNACDVCGIRP